MRATVEAVIHDAAPGFLTRWPGGVLPSVAELEEASAVGFRVEVTLASLTVRERAGAAEVSCELTLPLTTLADQRMFALAKGGATVSTSADADSLEAAKLDCVGAVLEDVVARQIVPAIQARR
jgi:hypothetical protein